MLRRQQLAEGGLEGGEGPQWDRLKVSLLKGPSQGSPGSVGRGKPGFSTRLANMKTARNSGGSPVSLSRAQARDSPSSVRCHGSQLAAARHF